eukprot:1446241-Prymnesium_polylepis.2
MGAGQHLGGSIVVRDVGEGDEHVEQVGRRVVRLQPGLARTRPLNAITTGGSPSASDSGAAP